MNKLIVGMFCAFLSAPLCAQSQSNQNQSPRFLMASGAVYWAHCDHRCVELRCQDKNACNKACIENKGTVMMCPRVDEKAK